MRNTIAALALVCTLTSSAGCYYGHARGAKTAAYLSNALVGGIGVVMVAGAGNGDDCPEGADVSCGVSSGVAAAGEASVGMLFVTGAVVGTIINLATRTDDERAPAPPARTAGARVAPSPFAVK